MLSLDEPRDYTHSPLLEHHESIDFDFILKILIVGDSGSGKTQLFTRFADETFTSDYRPTQSVEYRHRYIERNNFRCKTQVWDCVASGSATVMNSIYKGTNAVIICVDLTSGTSLDAVPDWVSEIHSYTNDNIHISMVGTKMDSTDRCVSHQNALDVAASLGLCYSEVSSKTGRGVEKVFVDVVSALQASAMRDLIPLEEGDRRQARSEDGEQGGKAGAGCCCCVIV